MRADLLRVRVEDAAAEARAQAAVTLRRRRLLHHNTIRVLLDQIEGNAEAADKKEEEDFVAYLRKQVEDAAALGKNVDAMKSVLKPKGLGQI